MSDYTYVGRKFKIFPFLAFALAFLISIATPIILKAQYASDIYTDFEGFWRSGLSDVNPILPNKSHDVIGFTYNGINYSTGVRDSVLTGNGISFTAGKYQTLPFTSIAGSISSKGSSDIYLALPERYDAVPFGFSSPLPTLKIKEALTDGINGLNIGTGVTNLPSSANMIFPAQVIDFSAIDDNQPDIIYAQLTASASSADVMLFQDSEGKTVGKSNPVQWNTVKSIGSQSLDYYNLKTGALIDTASIIGGVSSNTTQNLRLATFRLSDFGITAANASKVEAFVIKPAGTSDPAFIAYNIEALYIIPPIIISQPKSEIVCTGTGQSATFTILAKGLLLTYQWMKNGENIPGATGASYTIPVVTEGDAGTYHVVVTNPGGRQYSAAAYLNTTISRQPFPPVQTIVTGNAVTYSISATYATSFQWKKNGIDIPGAVDSIYTINPLTVSDSGVYTVSVINSGGNGCANRLSDPVSLIPAIVVYSKAEPDINIPSTWGANPDGSGSTPVDFNSPEHTFVLSNRPAASTLTDLTIAGTLDVKDGIATITDNTTLDVGRAIRTGAGSISGSSSAGLALRGNSNLYFTETSQILKNFTVAGGTVNMLSPLTISGGPVLPGKLHLTGGTLALNGYKITLTSSSVTNTSMVTTVGEGATINYGTGGAFVVERFYPAKRAFRFVSPPVTTITSIKNNWMEGINNNNTLVFLDPNPGYGTQITGALDPADSMDATQTFNPSLFTFDNFGQRWNTVYGSATTLNAGHPYRLMVRGSRSVDLNDNNAKPSNTIIRTTGSLTTGTVTLGSDVLNSTIGVQNFVGNPYASPVNWLTLTKTGLSNTYYAWDPSINHRGATVAYNGNTGTNSNSASKVDHNIQSGQAFFVQVDGPNPTLQFKESDKTGDNTRIFRGVGDPTKLSLQLMLNANGGSENQADESVVIFDDSYSKELGGEDSKKFVNPDENIAINRDGTELSIEGRPLVSISDTIPLKIWQFRQNNYLLKIKGQNFSSQVNAFVKDKFLKQETPINLSSSTIIPFEITDDPASSFSDRFFIVFETFAMLPVVLADAKAYQKDKGIQVDWNISTETNVDFYEVEKSADGQQFEKVTRIQSKGNSTVEQAYNWFDKDASAGTNYYRIKITDKTGAVTYSAVVRVRVGNVNNGITIFPNPAKGKEIGLSLSNLKKGKYAVNIYNSIGQKVFASSLQHRGGSASQTVLLTKTLSSGKYTLQVSNDEITLSQTIIVL